MPDLRLILELLDGPLVMLSAAFNNDRVVFSTTFPTVIVSAPQVLKHLF